MLNEVKHLIESALLFLENKAIPLYQRRDSSLRSE